MAQDHLGLFDTPPERREIRLALLVVVLVFAALVAALPVHDVRLGVIPAFVPSITAAMLICDLITATILYAQAAVFRSQALSALASGYLFGGLLLIPYALTFPGAFSAAGLLGAKVNTTGWIAVSWRMAVPFGVILYVLLKRGEAARPISRRPTLTSILIWVIGCIALTVAVTLLTTVGHDLLPSFFVDRDVVIRSTLIAVDVLTIGSTLAAIVLLFRQERSVLDMWLLVAMSAWLAQSLLNVLLHSRFSAGAYAFFGLVFVSNLIVMLALIMETIRLYARLALSTGARARERENRLMSMDAVAASIAHEVGQPLAAVRLNASAARICLNRSNPDAASAMSSLDEALASNERAFAIIKSIRETFSKGGRTLSEFSLNDLVRQTTSLLDRELAVQKVLLKLALDEALPPVTAHRVQIQRVLTNLLTNAIEAVASQPARRRRIAIRTAATEGGRVVLEITDSGAGISPEKAAQIFEPFFTTKSSGTGLGLSLSRTIVEEHGGRLWMESEEGHGATFHMQLNCGLGPG